MEYLSRKFYFLPTLLLLFVLRLALPQYVKFLLFPMLAITFIFAIVKLLKNHALDKFHIQSILSVFLPFFFVIVFYLAAFFFTVNKQDSLIKEFVNVLSVFSLLFVILILIGSEEDFSSILSSFSRYVIIASTTVAVFGFIKLYFQLHGIEFDFLNVKGLTYPFGTSLSIDNSFFNLICLFGIIFILPLLLRRNSKINWILIQFSLSICLLNIFLSTSRRGIIIASSILIVLMLLWIFSFATKNDKLRILRINTLGFGAVSLIFVSAILFFLYSLSNFKRNELLTYSKLNQYSVHSYINQLTLAGASIFKGNEQYHEINNKIWQSDFDSRYPFTGWASGKFNTISELPGDGDLIIPKGSFGAKIDKKANYIAIKGNAYYYSRLFEANMKQGKRYVVSLFCYASPEFNGDILKIATNGKVKGIITSNYDLSQRGKWQKLETSIFADSGKFSTDLYMVKTKANTFDSLNGFVVFAYPKLYEMDFDPRNPITWAERKYKTVEKISGENSSIVPDSSIGYLLDKESDFLYSPSSKKYITFTDFSKYNIIKGKRYISSIYCYVSNDFNGEKVSLDVNGKPYGEECDYYDLSRRGRWQKLILNNYGDGSFVQPFIYFEIPDKKNIDWLNGYVVFAYPETRVIDYSPYEPDSYSTCTYRREYPLLGAKSSIVPKEAIGYQLDKSTEGRVYQNSCRSTTDYLSIPAVSGDSIYASVYCFVSKNFSGDEVFLEVRGDIKGNQLIKYNLNKKGEWVKLESRVKAANDGLFTGSFSISKRTATGFADLKGHVTFACPVIKATEQKKNEIHFKPGISKKGSKRISDATLFSFLPGFILKNVINDDTIDGVTGFVKEMRDDNFAGPRLDRWRYTIYIYENEYSLGQKLIGSGFGSTKDFARMFLEKDQDYDYPHNPFLSVLLYSGLFGLIAYLWLIYKAIFYYCMYWKKYWTFAVSFGIIFFFAFFSADSPFDPAILGVFTIIPFCIHYYRISKSENAGVS
jgi:hypothetical protein